VAVEFFSLYDIVGMTSQAMPRSLLGLFVGLRVHFLSLMDDDSGFETAIPVDKNEMF